MENRDPVWCACFSKLVLMIFKLVRIILKKHIAKKRGCLFQTASLLINIYF